MLGSSPSMTVREGGKVVRSSRLSHSGLTRGSIPPCAGTSAGGGMDYRDKPGNDSGKGGEGGASFLAVTLGLDPRVPGRRRSGSPRRSEEHTYELKSPMSNWYAVFC